MPDKPRTITVDARALQQLLFAVVGPVHHIRELRAIYDLASRNAGVGDSVVALNDPISVLIDQYNRQIELGYDGDTARSPV